MGTHLHEAKEAGKITSWEELVAVAKAYDLKLSGRATRSRRTPVYSADERTAMAAGSVVAIQQVKQPQEQNIGVVGAVQGANPSDIPSGIEEYHKRFMAPLIARVDKCDESITGIRQDMGTMEKSILGGIGEMQKSMMEQFQQTFQQMQLQSGPPALPQPHQ